MEALAADYACHIPGKTPDPRRKYRVATRKSLFARTARNGPKLHSASFDREQHHIDHRRRAGNRTPTDLQILFPPCAQEEGKYARGASIRQFQSFHHGTRSVAPRPSRRVVDGLFRWTDRATAVNTKRNYRQTKPLQKYP